MTWWVGLAGLEEHWRRQREQLNRDLDQPEAWSTPPLLTAVIDDSGGRRIVVCGWTGWQRIPEEA